MDENITCQPPFNCPRIARTGGGLLLCHRWYVMVLTISEELKKSKRININNIVSEVKQIRRGRLGHVPTSTGIDFNKLH